MLPRGNNEWLEPAVGLHCVDDWGAFNRLRTSTENECHFAQYRLSNESEAFSTDTTGGRVSRVRWGPATAVAKELHQGPCRGHPFGPKRPRLGQSPPDDQDPLTEPTGLRAPLWYVADLAMRASHRMWSDADVFPLFSSIAANRAINAGRL